MPVTACRKTYITFKNGCLALLAQLTLHLCKVSCLCRCICALTAICAVASCNGFVWLSLCILAQRLGSADISVLAYNFWQATKASLLWA